MISLSDENRILASGKNLDRETAIRLLHYAKDLMTTQRISWIKPDPNTSPYAKSTLGVVPSNWLEELLIVSYRIIECFISNPNSFLENATSDTITDSKTSTISDESITESEKRTAQFSLNLPTQFVSILFYASIQLKQIDVVPIIIDRIVQNLICIDLLIPFFIRIDNFRALSLILNSFTDKLSDYTLFISCLYLSKYETFREFVNTKIDKLELKANTKLQKYQTQESPNLHKIQIYSLIIEGVASLRVSFLLQNQRNTIVYERIDTCITIITKSLEICPDSFQLHYNLAYLFAMQSQKDKCIEELKMSLQLKPNDPRSILFMMRMLRSNNQPSLAIQFYHSAKKLLNFDLHIEQFRNDDQNARNDYYSNENNLSYKHVNNGNKDTKKLILIEELYALSESYLFETASQQLDFLLKKYQGDSEVIASLIRLYLLNNNIIKATELFSNWLHDPQFIQENEENPEFYFCFANLCIEKKQYKEAEKLLKKSVDMCSDNVEYVSALACVLIKQGKMENALKEARKAIEIDPHSPKAWQVMAAAQTNVEEKEEAKQKMMYLEQLTIDMSNINLIVFPSDNSVLNV